MTATLSEDVKSFLKRDKKEVIYGRKGEKVKIINSSSDIWIVEGKERFTVRKDLLTNISNTI